MIRRFTKKAEPNIGPEKMEGHIVELLSGDYKGEIGLVTNYGEITRGTCVFTFLPFPEMMAKQVRAPKTLKGRVLSKDELNSGPYKSVMAERLRVVMENSGHRACTVGADPEVFVVDKKGVVIPAFDFLPRKGRGNPFWDGFQAEFTTSPSGSMNRSCLAYLTDNIQALLWRLLRTAREHNKDARLSWHSVVEIPNEMMLSAKPEHVDLGCAPSLNAYPHIKPINVENPAGLPIRFAGCHIHLGLGPSVRGSKAGIRTTKTIDAVFGPVSIMLLRGMEDERRRLYYGRAGEFRLPRWGLEYRTPSSAILSHPAVFHLCFDLIRIAGKLAGSPAMQFWIADEDEVVEAINAYDLRLARKIVTKNEKVLRAMLNRVYWRKNALVDAAMDMIKTGAKSWFSDIENMEKNWYLGERWNTHSGNPDCCIARLSRVTQQAAR